MRTVRSAIALVLGASLALIAPTSAHGAEGDEEGPSIAFTLPAGEIDGWWARSSMTIGVQVTDVSGISGPIGWARSGAGGGSGTLSANPGSVSVNVDGLTTVTITATDGEGNTATESVTVGLDSGLPFVTVTGRVAESGVVFAQHESVAITYVCGDIATGSGLASCEAPVPSGGNLDTSTVGTNQRFEITATDKVGRTLTRIVYFTVVAPVMSVTTPITLTGSGVVGTSLSGNEATFTPWPTSVTYAWHRDGVAIPGATGRTYSPRAADVDHEVTLVATAKRSAFADAQEVSDPVTVEPGTLTMDGDPVILGVPKVGEELTVDHPPVAPWGQVYTYRWIHDLDEEVAVTEEPTYVLGPEDVGHRVSVLVEVETPGYHPGGWFSLPTGPVAGAELPPPPPPAVDLPLVTAGAPAVAGTPVVGSTITATLPSFTAAPGAAVTTTVEWLRDGQPVAGASGTAYRLGAADVGHAISVRVTGAAANHRATSLTSPSTAPVGKAASALTLVARKTATGVRLTVRVSATELVPTGAVVVRARGKVVARLRLTAGSAATTVRGLRPGRVLLGASYAGDAALSASTAQRTVTIAKSKRR